MDALRLAQLDSALQLLASRDNLHAGRVFRIMTPLYANKEDALSGKGSRRASGRFHVKGAFLIAYTGCTLPQAEWEYSNTSRNSGITREDSLPLTTLSAEVNFNKVLDLADRAVRRRLKVTKQDLCQSIWSTSPDETLTQAIGRLAHRHGFEAIITPSAGPGDNLNILPQNLLPGSFVHIINEDRLPPSPGASSRKAGRSMLAKKGSTNPTTPF